MAPLESTPNRINASSSSSSIFDRISPAHLPLHKSGNPRGRRSSGVSLHHAKAMNSSHSPITSRSHHSAKGGIENESVFYLGSGISPPAAKTPRKSLKMNEYGDKVTGTPVRSSLRTRDTLPSDMKQLLKTQVFVGGKRPKEGVSMLSVPKYLNESSGICHSFMNFIGV